MISPDEPCHEVTPGAAQAVVEVQVVAPAFVLAEEGDVSLFAGVATGVREHRRRADRQAREPVQKGVDVVERLRLFAFVRHSSNPFSSSLTELYTARRHNSLVPNPRRTRRSSAGCNSPSRAPLQ